MYCKFVKNLNKYYSNSHLSCLLEVCLRKKLKCIFNSHMREHFILLEKKSFLSAFHLSLIIKIYEKKSKI